MENGNRCKIKISKLNSLKNLKNKVSQREIQRKKTSPKNRINFLRVTVFDIESFKNDNTIIKCRIKRGKNQPCSENLTAFGT